MNLVVTVTYWPKIDIHEVCHQVSLNLIHVLVRMLTKVHRNESYESLRLIVSMNVLLHMYIENYRDV